jgi:hypothetical protein
LKDYFVSFFQVTIKAKGKGLVKPFYILAHAGETMLFKRMVDRLQYTLPRKDFPEGIINLVLVDGNNRPVSSRMIFNRKESEVCLNVKSDKEAYSKRELVELAINLNKEECKGHFSIAVTDNEVVKLDSLGGNIVSTLLLTSDLKGYVEEPNYYFHNPNDDSDTHLDILMLTQGWKRFNIEALLNKDLVKPKFYLELGQTISGKFTRGLIRKSDNIRINALSTDPPVFATTITKEKGYFIFNNLNFQDSTVFTIQSEKLTNVRKEPAGIIEVEKDTFPAYGMKLPFSRNPESKKAGEDEFLHRLMFDGGEKHILLDELVIKGSDKSKTYTAKYGMLANVIDEKQIEEKYPVSMMADKLVQMLPGVMVRSEKIYFTGRDVPAEIILDGMQTDLVGISDIDTKDLKTIVQIKDATAALYSLDGGAGGVILMEMKEGGSFKRHVPGIVNYMPLGYQKNVDFYMPKYEVDSVRKAKQFDMRSTIYWNPAIRIDSTGVAQVRFYTADPSVNYTYIIEGMTEKGDLCRKVGTIYRKED